MASLIKVSANSEIEEALCAELVTPTQDLTMSFQDLHKSLAATQHFGSFTLPFSRIPANISNKPTIFLADLRGQEQEAKSPREPLFPPWDLQICTAEMVVLAFDLAVETEKARTSSYF